ncbi:hypothetical protein QYE76_036572 [Lolium multiflorum]|uniref:Ribonuclease H1 N-terminal domain-containing protein n=1 Tax=Lolium multiflorum TaxID=4521 RepID=A0AAD8R4N6_LOLMU|nr:hypothetical protein QYE76_036572 [Lolium multiflorum]
MAYVEPYALQSMMTTTTHLHAADLGRRMGRATTLNGSLASAPREGTGAEAGPCWPLDSRDLSMPTTYVVYKGRVPGVYDDWEDCRRQVHRFSGNSYKGYPTRVEAEGRYARYLAGEMRDMRRNRMKTMAFVMMVIVTMLVMFYVIVV